MRYGQFDDAAREYVIERPDTPRSWSNYLGSTEYGAVITNNAGGYSFYKSAAKGRFLRLRFNSIPMDQPGRYFYLRDNANGDFWSSSWQPVGKPLEQYRSTCRHGTGYTVIGAEYSGIHTESTYFVPNGQHFEYWLLRVTNQSKRTRSLSVFNYCEFAANWSTYNDLVNLQYSQYIASTSWVDDILRLSICDHLPGDLEKFDQPGHGSRAWLAMPGSVISGYDTNRETFLGPYRNYDRPLTVERGTSQNSLCYGDNPCGSLRTELSLAPGESREILVMLGVGEAATIGRQLVREYGTLKRAKQELESVKRHWHSLLENLHVETPDADFNHMLNTWTPYNSLITYSWSRAASLVYNGERDGLGYRDTVQDILGVLPLMTSQARERLELMLTGQLANGGAIPVIKPFSHQPGNEPLLALEEYRSDDCLWLFNTVPAYVAETGHLDFYHQVLPYADHGSATVLGHLRRALEFNLQRTGKNGLPCGLAADWNDCLKLGYHGESVFVAFQLYLGLQTYASIAGQLDANDERAWAETELNKLRVKMDACVWDRDWFIWAIGEDGTVYGTRQHREGAIYLNTQAWAVISGYASHRQALSAMDSVKKKLACEHGVMLCAPPFVKTPVDVMLAVLFVPGSKENAAVFNHTQGWAVMAECLLGRGDQAFEYYRSSLPAANNDRAEQRQSEPYVYSQTTHSVYSKQAGVARIPWLTGAATWAYHSAIHYILGIKPEVDGLRIDPCIPAGWPEFRIRRRFRGKQLSISVQNPQHICRGIREIRYLNKTLTGNLIPVSDLRDGMEIEVTMGIPVEHQPVTPPAQTALVNS
jgi:cellobiose phosphorylase